MLNAIALIGLFICLQYERAKRRQCDMHVGAILALLIFTVWAVARIKQ